MISDEHFNVILVGAGISGLGIAHHIQEQCPGKSFLILEEKPTYGGTWHTFKYPGIRSDSDLYTFGFRFKPWTGAPVADADRILSYLGDVIDEDKLDTYIRYNHKIISANWCSRDKRWIIDVLQKETGESIQLSCNFFIWSGGYFDHGKGYTPDWPGMSDFQGQIVHPQAWPEDISLSDKKVIVIGSGATAATVIPNITDDCAQVTMLQRSPTYFWSSENKNELADRLRLLEVPENCVHEIVRRDLLQTQKEIQKASAQHPEYMKEEFLKPVREQLGDEITEKHFTPTYRPWQQRAAYVPDNDLFNAINSGKVNVVTNHIERFTENGIQLQSGEILDADIIITATGFNATVIGGIPYSFDGVKLNPADSFTYRGIMISGFPNFAMMFGYLRTSWTMRVDLVGDYICRLLNHMDNQQTNVVTPTLRPQDANMNRNRWISEDEFNPGYFDRSNHLSPRSGDYEPWLFSPDYYEEKEQMPLFDLNEDALVYE